MLRRFGPHRRTTSPYARDDSTSWARNASRHASYPMTMKCGTVSIGAYAESSTPNNDQTLPSCTSPCARSSSNSGCGSSVVPIPSWRLRRRSDSLAPTAVVKSCSPGSQGGSTTSPDEPTVTPQFDLATVVPRPLTRSRLALLIDLGEELTLRGPGAGAPAATAAQDEGDADREHRPRERAGDIDPVGGERGGDEVGPERAGRVHGRSRDRAPPQAGEGDVAPHAERADDAEVLRPGCSAEDHADEPDGQDELHPERGPVGVARGGVIGAVLRGDVDDCGEEQRGECRAGQLRHDIAGDAPPGE